jgi:hypothetical protein
MAVRRRSDQRRGTGPPPVLSNVNVCAQVQQRPRQFEVTCFDGDDQRSVALVRVCGERVDRRPLLDESAYGFVVALLNRRNQSGSPSRSRRQRRLDVGAPGRAD